MTGAEVAIVIAVRDEATPLLRCLNALARLPEAPAFEVVIVDLLQDPATQALLDSLEGDVVRVTEESDRGIGPALDRGVAAASAPVVALLDASAVPVDGWLEAALDALQAAPTAAAVCPRTIALDGTIPGDGQWGCLLLRRDAYEAVGGFEGSSVLGRAEKTTLLTALRDAGRPVLDAPGAQVLAQPG
jgi:GT2 family glycosyltransferase